VSKPSNHPGNQGDGEGAAKPGFAKKEKSQGVLSREEQRQERKMVLLRKGYEGDRAKPRKRIITVNEDYESTWVAAERGQNWWRNNGHRWAGNGWWGTVACRGEGEDLSPGEEKKQPLTDKHS